MSLNSKFSDKSRFLPKEKITEEASRQNSTDNVGDIWGKKQSIQNPQYEKPSADYEPYQKPPVEYEKPRTKYEEADYRITQNVPKIRNKRDIPEVSVDLKTRIEK